MTNAEARKGSRIADPGSRIPFGVQHSSLAIDPFSLVAALRRFDVLEVELFLVQLRRHADALELPGRDIGEVLVVAPGLALGRLALFAEVAAAGFRAVP